MQERKERRVPLRGTLGTLYMKTVLTIAGSDCSGGAGIQADIKTITAHGLYAMSVITALTAQNTTGVYGVAETDPAFVARQMDCVFTDIFPDAVKIGMVSSAGIIRAIGQKLRQYRPKWVVLDPVMVATSGSRLLPAEAADALVEELFPLASLITPNLPEAEALTGQTLRTPAQMEQAARQLARLCPGAVLLKGGHLANTADDLLWQAGTPHWYSAPHIENPNTHGTGCTLSSAIACGLAKGLPLPQAVEQAKAYVTDALQAGLNLGAGSGPLNHCCRMPGAL